MDRPEPLHPGDAFGYRDGDGTPRAGERSAAWLDAVARLARQGAPAWPGLPGVQPLAPAVRRPIMARLSGTTSPYSWREVYPDPDSTAWLDHPAERGGEANAYEVNGLAGLGGQVARLYPGAPGDYRFQHVRRGAAPTDPDCPSITLTVTVRSASDLSPLQHATVEVFDAEDNPIASGMTNAFGMVVLGIVPPVPGEYVVAVNRLCYLEAGGPVDLECGPNTLTVDLTPDLVTCTPGREECGCPPGTLAVQTISWTLRTYTNGNPLSGASGTATLGGPGTNYQSGVLTFSPWTPPLSTTVRSARVIILCDLTWRTATALYNVLYYPTTDGTGSPTYGVSGDRNSDGTGLVGGCPTAPFHYNVYTAGAIGQPPTFFGTVSYP